MSPRGFSWICPHCRTFNGDRLGWFWTWTTFGQQICMVIIRGK